MEDQLQPAKLSLLQMAMLSMNMITTSVIVYYSQPFIPEMITFFGFKESQKGYYAGLIQTAFYTGRIFGSVVIGRIADKTSTYRVLMICFSMCAAIIFLFGFTFNIYFVIIIKLIMGVFSATALLNKVLIHELCSNDNQSFGMLFHIIGISIGGISGPLIGGQLQNPAKLFPKVFGNVKFFIRYPYFLCSLLIVVIAVVDVILLFFAERSIKPRETNTQKKQIEEIPTESTFKAYFRILKSKKTLISLAIYMIFSLCSIGTDELLILFLSTEILSGGLGFTSKSIGNVIMYCSIPTILFHILVFTILIKKVGIINIIKYGLIVVFPLTWSLSASYVLTTTTSPKYGEIFIYMAYIIIRSINSMMMGPIGLLINNAADIADMGTVNGIGMAVSSISRAIAPVFFEGLFASTIKYNLSIGKVFGSLFSFGLIALFHLCSVILCCFVPKSLNNRKSEAQITSL